MLNQSSYWFLAGVVVTFMLALPAAGPYRILPDGLRMLGVYGRSSQMCKHVF